MSFGRHLHTNLEGPGKRSPLVATHTYGGCPEYSQRKLNKKPRSTETIQPIIGKRGPLSYLLKTQLFNFLGNMAYMSVKDELPQGAGSFKG